MRKFLVVATLSLGVSSCFPISFSGSNTPTEHTFKLTPADIEAAQKFDVDCALDWVTSDATANRDRSLEELKKLDIKVVERDAAKFATAFRARLLVGNGFDEKPIAVQAMTLTHELVHYCERGILGDNPFDQAYAHSAGRWIAETPAYAQSIRTAVLQGASSDNLTGYIDDKVESMRNFYFLWDIDTEIYEEETRIIWSAAAGF